jgi:hypothetical protein
MQFEETSATFIIKLLVGVLCMAPLNGNVTEVVAEPWTTVGTKRRELMVNVIKR